MDFEKNVKRKTEATNHCGLILITVLFLKKSA